MEELLISHTESIIVGTLPERLTCLKILNMEWCNLSSMSNLNRFPALKELTLSFNNALLLDTLPYNLTNL